MRRAQLLSVLVGIWLIPRILLGDGAVISPTAFAKVRVPDQSALISYDGTTERLLIETSFIGSGTNFAWIVPLPSLPEVEAGTSGTIPTLQIAFRPEVHHNVPSIYGGILALGALIYLFATVRATGQLTAGDIAACALFSFGLGVSVSWFLGGLCLLSCFPVRDARRGSSLIIGLGIVILFSIILSGLLLPALSTASVSVSMQDGVRVHDRKIIGNYETATLSSPDGAALLEWLRVNGFPAPTNISSVVKDYAREGWSFVAARVRRDQDTPTATAPHPLVFTFKTAKPVYPLRLTGAGHDDCRVDLFVFGPERAAIPGFMVERCEKLDASGLQIRHPQIVKLTTNTVVATKLTAQLRAEDMLSDGWITWQPFVNKRPLFFSRHGAVIMTTNIVVALLGLTLAVYWLAAMAVRWQPVCRIVGGAFAVALVLFLALPKVPVNLTYMPTRTVRMQHRSIAKFLEDAWIEHVKLGKPPAEPTLDWLRAETRKAIVVFSRHESLTQNPYTGRPWREEDSPGNAIFRKTKSGWGYVWYSLDGQENVTRLFW